MLATAAGAVVLALGGCLGTSAHRHSTPLAGGGVLRVGLSALDVDPDRLDPQRSFTGSSVELFRCCLLRTLLSYRGVPTEQGGGVLRPDLASGMPTVSADGRTWTFHLRPGLRYAPPFDRDTIRSGDFVRAIERLLRLAPAPYLAQYFLVIEGAAAFAAHQTDSIAGLETPDPQTLIVHLTRPTGDFGNRVALPPAAPLPPGAADNHPHDYGRFMAASGPYMIAGSQRLRGPTARPVAGFVPGRSLTLVRNPSWARASDRLRPARVDRIEVKIGGTASDLAREVEESKVDVPFFYSARPDEGAPMAVVRRYLATPMLRRRLFIQPGSTVRGVSLNLLLAPFDDVHVRKAVNLVLDKQALLRDGGEPSGALATHIVPDALENDLLLEFNPYRTPSGRGDPQLARREMARSRYDRDGDGVCDAAACRHVLAATRAEPLYRRQARTVRRDLVRLGIHLRFRRYSPETYFSSVIAARPKLPLIFPLAWTADYPNASTYFAPLFYGPSFRSGLGNPSLVGASPAELRRLGYRAGSVASIDPKIAQCLTAVGEAQFSCWAEADMLLMSEVVPWAPYEFVPNVELVSARVRDFSSDQSSGFPLPALDRIAVGSRQRA